MEQSKEEIPFFFIDGFETLHVSNNYKDLSIIHMKVLMSEVIPMKSKRKSYIQ